MANDKVMHLKYPEDISPNRYVSLEFFIPANESNMRDLIKSMEAMGVSLYNTMQGRDSTSADISKAFSSLKNDSSRILKAAGNETIFNDNSNTQFNKRELKAILYLPLPNALNDNASNTFSETTGPISSLVEKINSNVATKSVNEISNSVGSRNVLANSDMNLLYKGSGLRRASLTWTFMPRSKKEAQEIVNIIKIIKKYSSPDASISRHFLLSPAFVNLTLSNPLLNDLQRYSDMVINNVSIDYGSGGNMEMFYDGMLKEITLNISLSELKINTLQDWEDDKTYLNEENRNETFIDRSKNLQVGL